jgi:hypothetical protein
MSDMPLVTRVVYLAVAFPPVGRRLHDGGYRFPPPVSETVQPVR